MGIQDPQYLYIILIFTHRLSSVLKQNKGIDLLEKIKKLEVKDDKMIKAIEEIKQAGVKILRDKEW